MKKYTYVLGLKSGGLMEDPDWHICQVFTIHADNLREAKDKWALLTKEDKEETWDKDRQTIWGWDVVCLNTNDPDVEIIKIDNNYTDLYDSNDEQLKRYIKENAVLIVPDDVGRFYDGANTISHLTGIDKDRIALITDPNFNYENIKVRIYNNMKENAESEVEDDKKNQISKIEERSCLENISHLLKKLHYNFDKDSQEHDSIIDKKLEQERTQILLSMRRNIDNLKNL